MHFRNQNFQVAGIQSKTEVLGVLLWTGFHYDATATTAKGVSGICFGFIRWPTTAYTNIHPKKDLNGICPSFFGLKQRQILFNYYLIIIYSVFSSTAVKISIQSAVRLATK